MKNVIKLDNYYSPADLQQALAAFVDYYNNHRYHESLNMLTPADVYFGRCHQMLDQRKRIKEATLKERRRVYIAQQQAELYNNIFSQNSLSQKKEGF